MKILSIFTASVFFKDGSAIENETFILRYDYEKNEEKRYKLTDNSMKILNTLLGDFLMCNFGYDCSGYAMIPLELGKMVSDPVKEHGPLCAIAIDKLHSFRVHSIRSLTTTD